MRYNKELLSNRIEIIDQIEFKYLKNIKIGSALSDMADINGGIVSVLGLLKLYLFRIMEYTYSANKVGKGRILFFYSNANRTRKYVQDKMQRVDDLCESKISVRSYKRRFHMKGFFGINYVYSWYKQLRNKKFTWKESLLLALHILEAYFNLQDLLKVVKYDINNIRLIVSVHDNRMIDSVAIQYFNSIGIETCTLQHGEFAQEDLWLDIGLSFSKYFCIYGDMTYNRFIKEQKHNNIFVKLGMPQMIGVKHELKKCQNNCKFGVFLDFIAYADGNIPMIRLANKLAEKYNLTFFIKYHPSLDKIDYTSECSEKCTGFYRSEVLVNDIVKDVDFAITSMSSMFGELIFQGIPALRFVQKGRDTYDGVDFLKLTCFDDFEKYYKTGCTDLFYAELEAAVHLISETDDPEGAYRVFMRKFEEMD